MSRPEPVVHSGFQRGLRPGLDLRLPSGSVALLDCGGNLVTGRSAALVAVSTPFLSDPSRTTQGADVLIGPAEQCSADLWSLGVFS